MHDPRHSLLAVMGAGGCGAVLGLEGDAMMLTYREVVRTVTTYPMEDQRRRLTVVTAAYQDEEGHEYRKVFESYGYPEIPKSGTHKEINGKRKQW